MSNPKEEQLSLLSNSYIVLRRNISFTDVNLICKGNLPAHRVLLAASSPYFMSMFTSGMKETFANSVGLPIFDFNIMEIILDFIYTGNIKASLDNPKEIKALLAAADHFQLITVFEFCCNLLLQTLSKSSFIDLIKIAVKYTNNEMKNKIVSFIATNFEETSVTHDFLLLPFEVVNAVTKKDIQKENSVELKEKAIYNWVKYNEEEREENLDVLLSDIHKPPSMESLDNQSPNKAETSRNEEVVFRRGTVIPTYTSDDFDASLFTEEDLDLADILRPASPKINAFTEFFSDDEDVLHERLAELKRQKHVFGYQQASSKVFPENQKKNNSHPEYSAIRSSVPKKNDMEQNSAACGKFHSISRSLIPLFAEEGALTKPVCDDPKDGAHSLKPSTSRGCISEANSGRPFHTDRSQTQAFCVDFYEGDSYLARRPDVFDDGTDFENEFTYNRLLGDGKSTRKAIKLLSGKKCNAFYEAKVRSSKKAAEMMKNVKNYFFVEERKKARKEQLTMLSNISDYMRRNSILTDVSIVCRGKELSAHRVVLAASSLYFYTLFTSNSRSPLPYVVSLPSIHHDAMETVLEFIYTGEINTSLQKTEELKTIFAVASQLKVNILLDYCCSLLLQTLSTTHFLELWEIANKHGNNYLNYETIKYIAEHFPETSAAPEFMELPVDDLIAVIVRDEMKRHDLDAVVNTLFKWAKTDRETREPQLKSLFAYINFLDLSEEFRHQIVDNEPLMSLELMRLILKTVASKPCKPLTNFTCKFGITSVSCHSPDVVSYYVSKSTEEQRFLIMKKVDFDNGWIFRWYYPRTGTASDVLSFKFSILLESAVCNQNGNIYFIGGKDKYSKVYPTMSMFNIVLYNLETLSPMNEARFAAGAIIKEDFIYIAGGVDCDNNMLDSVERYDFSRNVWETVAPMQVKRRQPTLLNGRNKIYAMGGILGSWGSPLEYYDPASNVWTTVTLDVSFGNKLRQTVCYVIRHDGAYHILARSQGGTVYWYTKKHIERKYLFNLEWSSPGILCVASIKTYQSSVLFVINNEGVICTYNPKHCGWFRKICPLTCPDYAIYLGKGTVVDNL